MKYPVAVIALWGAMTAHANAQPPVTLQSAPPVVVETVPPAGSDNVDPRLATIKVTFSKKMQDGSWSWVQLSEASFPKLRGQPRYLADGKTNVVEVALKPNQTYAVWFNTDEFLNFKDEQGRAAVPYLLVFRTGELKE